MSIIVLYKRYHRASMEQSIQQIIKESESGKITPSKCPAIRQAYNLGCYVNSPRQYDFNNGIFNIKRYKIIDTYLFDPGVIGDPSSKNLFARIDTGYSFQNLEIDVLATPILAPLINDDFQIPPVVYPKGYTGPILAPISSRKNISIKEFQPILHLIPLSLNHRFEVVNEEISHTNFEGLIYDSLITSMEFVDEKSCIEFMR
jgi:hypothetical protein